VKNILLEIENLNIDYFDGETPLAATKDIGFSIFEGETLGIIGESGSGKTSIANAIMRILPANASVSGRISYKNRDILKMDDKEMKKILWNEIAMIFQNSLDVLNPLLTIGEQIAETLREHKSLKRKEAEDITKEYLEKVGLEKDDFKAYPHQLSGGMRQRALIAMGLVCQPKLLIADELTSALDAKTKSEILDLLSNLQKEFNFSLLLISHELDTIASLTERLMVLYRGQLLEEGFTKEILRYQYHPYSRGLINSSTTINVYKDLWGIPARKTLEEGDGCPFYSRCNQKIEICKLERPSLISLEASRKLACHQGGILEVLRGEDISKSFMNKNGQVRACIDCSLYIRQGEFISLVGQSGSGKTTLANILSGVLKKDSGSVLFKKENSEAMKLGSQLGGVQIVFQDPFSSINENFTVLDAVREPLQINKLEDQVEEKVKEYLSRVELENSTGYLARRIHSLSGGQRQRVALARALIMEPELLIADEICSMLDKSTEANILRLLKKLQNEEGFSMIYITHNLNVALKLSDRILVMNEGRIVESGNPVTIMKNPKDKYTKDLIRFNKKNELLLYD